MGANPCDMSMWDPFLNNLRGMFNLVGINMILWEVGLFLLTVFLIVFLLFTFRL